MEKQVRVSDEEIRDPNSSWRLRYDAESKIVVGDWQEEGRKSIAFISAEDHPNPKSLAESIAKLLKEKDYRSNSNVIEMVDGSFRITTDTAVVKKVANELSSRFGLA